MVSLRLFQADPNPRMHIPQLLKDYSIKFDCNCTNNAGIVNYIQMQRCGGGVGISEAKLKRTRKGRKLK